MTFDKIKKLAENTEGWLRPIEIKFLYEQAKRLQNKGVILEIGSYKGKSTICLAGGSEEGKKVRIIAVDPHMTDLEQKVFNNGSSSLEDFKRNIANSGLESFIELIVKKSEDAVVGWNKPIEFLWIDGDHSYEGAKLDFDLWSPFLVDGGVVAFHDSNDHLVQKVIKERIFSSPYFSDSGIAGSISFATKHCKPVSHFERLRNRLVFFYIVSQSKAQRKSLSVLIPSWIKVLVNKSLGKISYQ